MPWINHVATVRIPSAPIRNGLRVPSRSDQMPTGNCARPASAATVEIRPIAWSDKPRCPRYSGKKGKVKPIPATPKKYDP